MIFVGDDWAEDHHDVYVMDQDGTRLVARRLPEGLAGIGVFHELMAAHATEPDQVVIGIETDRGLWVEALTAADYQVYAVNPLAVARYRDRHHVSGAKSDASDAKLLADLVRTDRHNHRPIAGDSPDVEAIKVLARGHQNLIWARNRHTNALRSALREYYPAALEAFGDLHDRDTLAVLGRAPYPGRGRPADHHGDLRGAAPSRPTPQPRATRYSHPGRAAHRATVRPAGRRGRVRCHHQGRGRHYRRAEQADHRAGNPACGPF
jgi:transposase